MNFETFVNRVKEDIKEYLPEKFQNMDFVVKQHEKLNENYTALTIDNQTVAPIVNLEDYYWDHMHGRCFSSIMDAIAETFEFEEPKVDFDMLKDFDQMKQKLFIRVSSAEKNEEYLKGVPHTIMEDIAITYHIQMNMDVDGVSSITVTNEMLQRYGVNKEELHVSALENSEKIFPVNIFDLHEYTRQNYINDLKLDGKTEEEISVLLKDFPDSGEKVTTVVSNDVGINGAAVIFYPGIMDELAKRTEGDFFILPSSVHETLVLADNGSINYKELLTMVCEINETQVEPWDRLTDQVYHYDPIDKVFEKADSFENRIALKAEMERNAKKKSIMDVIGEKKEAAKAMVREKNPSLKTAEVSL